MPLEEEGPREGRGLFRCCPHPRVSSLFAGGSSPVHCPLQSHHLGTDQGLCHQFLNLCSCYPPEALMTKETPRLLAVLRTPCLCPPEPWPLRKEGEAPPPTPGSRLRVLLTAPWGSEASGQSQVTSPVVWRPPSHSTPPSASFVASFALWPLNLALRLGALLKGTLPVTHSHGSTNPMCPNGPAIAELVSLACAWYHLSGPGNAARQPHETLEMFTICFWTRKKE